MTGVWVVVSAARAATVRRDPGSLPELDGPCPFCPGAESETEATIAAHPARGPWQIRVVSNRYPALRPEVREVPRFTRGHARAAVGYHEILIESREHTADISSYALDHLVDVLRMIRERLAWLESRPGVRHVVVFRNRGVRSGSSQPHPHAQLAAVTVDVPEPRRRWEKAVEARRRDGATLLDTVLTRELAEHDRLVEVGDEAVSLCPFAPRYDHEVWVAPLRARGSFSAAGDDTLRGFAAVLQRAVRAALEVSGRCAYNLVWRLPPTSHRVDPAAFWYVEVIPRGGTTAGFELTTGTSLVAASPERSASAMRALAGQRARGTGAPSDIL